MFNTHRNRCMKIFKIIRVRISIAVVRRWFITRVLDLNVRILSWISFQIVCRRGILLDANSFEHNDGVERKIERLELLFPCTRLL
jgi:hypothetical protein